MNIPPPQWPPPDTDCTGAPSSTIQELSYPYQRQVRDAPIGSMTYSASTPGSGRRQMLSAASASTLTRTSLYSYDEPGSLRARVSQEVASRSGRSAQSGF